MSEIKVTAAISGSIWQIVAAVGDSVSEDQPIIIMESMKMEINITSPVSGTVTHILQSEGARVQAGQTLIALEE